MSRRAAIALAVALGAVLALAVWGLSRPPPPVEDPAVAELAALRHALPPPAPPPHRPIRPGAARLACATGDRIAEALDELGTIDPAIVEAAARSWEVEPDPIVWITVTEHQDALQRLLDATQCRDATPVPPADVDRLWSAAALARAAVTWLARSDNGTAATRWAMDLWTLGFDVEASPDPTVVAMGIQISELGAGAVADLLRWTSLPPGAAPDVHREASTLLLREPSLARSMRKRLSDGRRTLLWDDTRSPRQVVSLVSRLDELGGHLLDALEGTGADAVVALETVQTERAGAPEVIREIVPDLRAIAKADMDARALGRAVGALAAMRVFREKTGRCATSLPEADPRPRRLDLLDPLGGTVAIADCTVTTRSGVSLTVPPIPALPADATRPPPNQHMPVFDPGPPRADDARPKPPPGPPAIDRGPRIPWSSQPPPQLTPGRASPGPGTPGDPLRPGPPPAPTDPRPAGG